MASGQPSSPFARFWFGSVSTSATATFRHRARLQAFRHLCLLPLDVLLALQLLYIALTVVQLPDAGVRFWRFQRQWQEHGRSLVPRVYLRRCGAACWAGLRARLGLGLGGGERARQSQRNRSIRYLDRPAAARHFARRVLCYSDAKSLCRVASGTL